MTGDSSSFHLLDERIQRYIWNEGWTELRDAQERAIPIVLPGESDVIIAAATAAGKTEAAFLPALTRLLREGEDDLIIYVSPLKALINDQFGRLDRLCEYLEIPVWPWHGDISASLKTRFLKSPKGVLLITPESLEATLCNRGTSVAQIFAKTIFIVVDELHAFIGTERGKQLQSLLHRIERAVRREIPRIGLSATLGDMSLAADFLRPGGGDRVQLIESKESQADLRILVRGFEEPLSIPLSKRENRNAEDEIAVGRKDVTDQKAVEQPLALAPGHIAGVLFQALRGSNNLIFPNSRREVERYTHLLSELCDEKRVPNEFWPHHGSLSKEIRAETEEALKRKERPATAVCTNTLELGIDIGAVKSVAQIGPAPSVASLRQRLGRSGRRKGEPAILRGFSIEEELPGNHSLSCLLRLSTVEMIAGISLLLERWFEPPKIGGLHLSTMIQQLLSAIAQNGGLQAGAAYALLCGEGAPFAALGAEDFKTLLRHLGGCEVLMQDSSGLLLHGRLGEKIVNHYTFYAAFATDEEFRIVTKGQSLGTLPISQLLVPGQHILFAGKTWYVDEIREQDKTIFVSKAKSGTPPSFSGGAGRVHTSLRQRMRELLETSSTTPYLDEVAQRFLDEGRRSYAQLDLSSRFVASVGAQVMVLTWLGDAANEAIACILRHQGFTAWPAGPGVEVMKKQSTSEEILAALADAAVNELPAVDDLLAEATNLQRDKWDRFLPDELLRRGYASMHLDFEEAKHWLERTFSEQVQHVD